MKRGHKAKRVGLWARIAYMIVHLTAAENAALPSATCKDTSPRPNSPYKSEMKSAAKLVRHSRGSRARCHRSPKYHDACAGGRARHNISCSLGKRVRLAPFSIRSTGVINIGMCLTHAFAVLLPLQFEKLAATFFSFFRICATTMTRRWVSLFGTHNITR
jgi:hypothetical protein